VWLLCQVDNDDYVRRVLKTDDVKPPAGKPEPQRESSSRSKVRVFCDAGYHPVHSMLFDDNVIISSIMGFLCTQLNLLNCLLLHTFLLMTVNVRFKKVARFNGPWYM